MAAGAFLLPTLDPVLVHAAAGSLGAVLLLSAAEKLREPAIFRDTVETYQLLPAPAAAAFAWLLPLTEFMAGALLLPVATRTLGAALALALLTMFSAAIAINLGRGRTRIDCGCGASGYTPLSRGLLARNALLMLLAVAAAAPMAARSTVWLDFAAAGFALLFLLGLYFLANAMLSQHSHLLDLRNSP